MECWINKRFQEVLLQHTSQHWRYGYGSIITCLCWVGYFWNWRNARFLPLLWNYSMTLIGHECGLSSEFSSHFLHKTRRQGNHAASQRRHRCSLALRHKVTCSLNVKPQLFVTTSIFHHYRLCTVPTDQWQCR